MPSHPNPAPAKCESKSGHVDGLRNRRTIAPLRPTTQKRASGNERALKKGGTGVPPPRLFASGLSLEKAWIPARDRAGTHVAGSTLRWSQRDHLPMTEGPGPLPLHFSGEMGTPPGRRAPGALRPEAPEEPRPPAGYAVPHRAPARDRAGTHVAGPTLRRSQRDHLPITKAPRPSQGAQFMGQCPASPASAPGRQPPPGLRLRPEGCGRPPPGWRRW